MSGSASDGLAKGPERYSGGWTKKSVYAVAILAAIHTFYYIDRQSFGLVLPLLKKDLQLSDTVIGLVAGLAFVLFNSLLAIPIARLADRSNRRNILAAGVGFWSLMTALTGAVTNVWQLASARFLMGAGEAAGLPPLTSMVADMFNRSQRPLAMSLATCGNAMAALIAFPILGLVAYHYGWRVTFLAAGVPGLILGLLLFFTVKEPTRTREAQHKAQESFPKTLAFLLGQPAYVLTVLGAGLMGISLYADQVWNPSFLTRVHGLNLAQVGVVVGVVKGVMGLTGGLLGGVLVSRLCKKNDRWRLWVPAIACMLVLPSELTFLLSPDLPFALVGYACAAMFAGMHYAQVFSVCQDVARPAMRATAVAMFILCVGPIGQVFGPLIVGFLNDYWAQRFGEKAIRYSLIVGSLGAFIGGAMMLIGSIFLPRSIAKAQREEA